MNVIGFDPAVARANGYPATPPRSVRRETQDGIVYGNCGFSYVWLFDAGTRVYRMDTGFGVDVAAVSYKWQVQVTAPGYNKWHNYGGGLWFRKTWTNSDAYATIPYASSDVRAYVAVGTATLANGLVCTTGHPTDIAAIY